MEPTDLVSYSYEQGEKILEKRSSNTLKEQGQFLTPPNIARYMAKQLGAMKSGDVLLDPSIGSGVLVCAVIERLMSESPPESLVIEAYETDSELCEAVRQILTLASDKAGKVGLKIKWQVHQEDFVLACLPEAQPALFSPNQPRQMLFNAIISNPPYFKLNSDDKRVKAVSGKINGHTNIYTLFMALSAKLLAPQGKACFIVPRSFCSGVYFSEFRRDLLRDVTPLSVHLFQSRDELFKGDEVIQENVIFTFEKPLEPKAQRYWAGTVNISTASDESDLEGTIISRSISFQHFLSQRQDQVFFRLPTGILDEQVIEAVDLWDGSLERYGLQVSTGRVVPFRATKFLKDKVNGENTVPLLWMQHVKSYMVEYPLEHFDKPQAITIEDPTLLVPNSNYVLLRRFSAKEDRRRLIAAPLQADQFAFNQIGFENHLNFIYRKNGTLNYAETIGLSALLNSAIVDRYFRIVNGNTQVNAAELRALPLPPWEVLQRIGEKIQSSPKITADQVDNIVFSTLWEMDLLPEEFPIIQETRITMGKIEQAQDILESLGLPSAQQNEMSALTLLVLAQLSEKTLWEESKTRSVRVHDILIEIKQRYGREYAENTRETIRRYVLHQFEQAGIVVRNLDNPALATNSPLTHYILSDVVVEALQAYGSAEWKEKLQTFISQRGTLLEIYQKSREQNKVALQVADGKVYKLSPGKHNKLQAAIIKEFGPRFAPGAKLLYLGDTASKTLLFEKVVFTELRVPVTDHGKLPDIVLFDEIKNWIFLVEAVTSHGPVSPKRQFELEDLFKNCKASRVYVTAFLDFATFKRFLSGIAWETEVWIAELPSHMIHFNGDKFLGPR
jgi:adenine-specific DNA-methyltransferase